MMYNTGFKINPPDTLEMNYYQNRSLQNQRKNFGQELYNIKQRNFILPKNKYLTKDNIK